MVAFFFFDISKCEFSNFAFFFFMVVLSICVLDFYMNFRNNLSIFVKKKAEILTEIALNLKINLESIAFQSLSTGCLFI